MESLPLTYDALLQHTFGAAFQAGHVWAQALIPQQHLPSPTEWGWTKSDIGYEPYWTSREEASLAIRELIKCGCNPEKGCRGRCKCLKAELRCSELCKCNGDCERE